MKLIKRFFVTIILLTIVFSVDAQLGIRAGLNMASEITSFSQQGLKNSFSSGNLTGYQIGLVYQTYTKGLGFEIGTLLSQKGSVYQYNDAESAENNLIEAYKEINCVTVPINLRYRISTGSIGIFGLAGVYGDYALNGKTVIEAFKVERKESFENAMDRIDYGYTLGAGIEVIKKVQLGFNWSAALTKKDASKGFYDLTNYRPKTTSKMFSVNLTYLF
ncbi:MAG: outer membrane beta-barrel protein [Paludibacteraceae bacterium]